MEEPIEELVMNPIALMRFGGLCLATFLISTPAHANAAVPMVVAGWLAIFVALIPIILVETLVFLVRAKTSFWEAGLAMSLANIASTFVGIPLASWFHATFADEMPKKVNSSQEELRMVFWHVQYADETVEVADRIWIGGGLVLMALFFFASWLTEQWVVEMVLSGYPRDALGSAVLVANSVTYGLLLAFFGGSIFYEYRANRTQWHTDPSRKSAITSAANAFSPTTRHGPVDPWFHYRNQENRVTYDYGAIEAEAERRTRIQPVLSLEFRKSWLLANTHAKQGISRLAKAESRIENRPHSKFDSRIRDIGQCERSQAA